MPSRNPLRFSYLPRLGLSLLLAGALCHCSEPPQEAKREDATPVAAPANRAAQPAAAAGRQKTLRLSAEEGSAEQLKRTVAILNERLRLAGIPGQALLEGERQIVVTLPDDKAVLQRAAGLLLAGGELLFYPLVTEEQMKLEEIDRHIAEVQKAKEEGAYDRAKAQYDVALRKEDDKPALLENPPVPGYLLSQVSAAKDQNGKPSIDFVMTEAGSAEYLAFTTKHVKRLEAIVFDGKMILAPTILEPIEGSGIITGDFTEQEVEDMVTILKSGKLPVDLNLEAE